MRRNWGWGCEGERARCTPGECARQAPGCLSHLDQGRHKTTVLLSPRFVGCPKTGTARSAGHAPYRAARSLSSVDRESTDTHEQRQTQCGRNTVSATHTQQYLSAAPRPPRSRNELVNLNKRSPPPASVRAEIRHRREGKQKPNKQRELLQTGPVQQIKIPVGNTDYTGRGLQILRSVSWNEELFETELNPHWRQQLQRNS